MDLAQDALVIQLLAIRLLNPVVEDVIKLNVYLLQTFKLRLEPRISIVLFLGLLYLGFPHTLVPLDVLMILICFVMVSLILRVIRVKMVCALLMEV
jgi:hypothetical protein